MTGRLTGKRVAVLIEDGFEDAELTSPIEALRGAGAVKNAGGLYVDKPVVIDGNLITSRKPDDLGAFNAALIQRLAEADG